MEYQHCFPQKNLAVLYQRNRFYFKVRFRAFFRGGFWDLRLRSNAAWTLNAKTPLATPLNLSAKDLRPGRLPVASLIAAWACPDGADSGGDLEVGRSGMAIKNHGAGAFRGWFSFSRGGAACHHAPTARFISRSDVSSCEAGFHVAEPRFICGVSRIIPTRCGGL